MRGAVLLSFGLVLAMAHPTLAQSTPDADLAAVREQVLHATYRPASTAVDAYLARADLDAAQRNAGLELQAIVRLALRDERGASASLAELYARDPGHRLNDPDASPVVQSAFARAREGASPRTVMLESDTDEHPTRRGAPVVSVRVGEGADAVQEVRISYRHSDAGRWATLVVAPEDGAASASVPLAGESAEESIAYYVEALAPSGTVIGSLASADAPRTVTVPAAPVATATVVGEEEPSGEITTTGGGSVAEEAWFWVLIGVVVVGAGVGTGVGIALSQPGPQEGTLGHVTLPLVSF